MGREHPEKEEKILYDEKRWFHRYPFCAAAGVRRKDTPDSPPLKSLVGNISETGVGLYVSEALELETPVSVEITFVDINKKPQQEKINGSIARIYQENDMYFIGISFTEKISQEKQPNLYHHFHRIIKE